MGILSVWAADAIETLKEINNYFYSSHYESYKYNLFNTTDSLWLRIDLPGNKILAFRAVYSPGSSLVLLSHKTRADKLTVKMKSAAGSYRTEISFSTSDDCPVLHYQTTFKASQKLAFPFCPKDVLAVNQNGMPAGGVVHFSQEGTRSGLSYFSFDDAAGSALYFQNFTALNDYFNDTKTTPVNSVGGMWPEFGFSLPPSESEPLEASKEYILSDAFIAFSELIPSAEIPKAKLYLDLLAAVYKSLPKPATTIHDYPAIVKRSLNDLMTKHACWSQKNGRSYLNAYVCDYDTPPEIMVQLAVLMPMYDYSGWSGEKIDVATEIEEGLPSFFDPGLGTVMRWLPAAEDDLDGSEEQKKPKVMDSWYLHHPLLNLSRLALMGHSKAKELFLNSLDFAIKVAHKFNYNWPVFYNMETLEVIKAETSPGKGGEKDVAGLYSHVMLQAYELTGKKKFLNEAERAARTLRGKDFEIFYQANNTAFSSGALLRLYKLTGKSLYLDLSYLCLASVFRNVKLWSCNYGNGRYYADFFSVFPLSDAPYTAVYEEQEVFAGFHEYLLQAKGLPVPKSILMLLAEYIKYFITRAVYYYPPCLPEEMLSKEPKMGEIDRNLWIALEDMQDGWEPSGSVGQEVYGAGLTFGIVPRHYFRAGRQAFLVFTDYPAEAFNYDSSNKAISFRLKGDCENSCTVALIKTDREALPEEVKITCDDIAVKTLKLKGGNLGCSVHGNTHIRISWK